MLKLKLSAESSTLLWMKRVTPVGPQLDLLRNAHLNVKPSFFEEIHNSFCCGWLPPSPSVLLASIQMLQDCAKARREVELHWRASPCTNIVRIIDVYENLYQGRKCLLIVMEWWVPWPKWLHSYWIILIGSLFPWHKWLSWGVILRMING